MKLLAVAVCCAAACLQAGQAPTWHGYGGNAQHTALSTVPAQSLDLILWQTPVDLEPQYTGGEYLFIHYASPLITAANTFLLPVKTGPQEGFRIDAFNGTTGVMKWLLTSDYLLPPHGNIWTPSYPCALTPQNRLYLAGAGGTVDYIDNPDAATGTVTGRFAFYGLFNYQADPASFNSTVYICTPLTSDAAGNIFFGFYAKSNAPFGLTSGFARIQPNGVASFITSQAAAGGDAQAVKPVFNCAPALSNDGTTLYVAVSNTISTNGTGQLCALNAANLAYVTSVVLRDPSGTLSHLPDDGTASPVIGPDGDVYFGTLENPFPSNNARGWLLHFSADLGTQKITGAFGWDDTPSIVPAAMIPSYAGPSTYLLAVKYNNYAGIGSGTGVNKLAILDPNTTQIDPISGRMVMTEILTIAGITPDQDFLPQYPNAVREWCINTAVVDPATSSVYAGSEDGVLYRWHLPTNSFTQAVRLTEGIGEAYTPTLIGTGGIVYAINNATLFAVGAAVPPAFTNGPPPAATTVNIPYAFTYSATGIPAPTFSVNSGALPDGLTLNTATGALSGTPILAGVFTGTVTASNSAGNTPQNFSITINPAIALTPALPPGMVSQNYTQTITATGGTGAKMLAVTAGSIPPGLTLDSAGNFSGAPTASGRFNFTVTATDTVNAIGQQSYTLDIAALTISVSPLTLPNANVAVPYAVQFTATGGIEPYSFAAFTALPAGLSISSSGLLSGTPAAEGIFSFTLAITDSNPNGASTENAAFSLLVDQVPVFLSGPTATPNPALINFAVTFDAATSPSDALIAWNFGDGSSGAGTVTQHIYSLEGTYVITASAQNPRTQATTSASLTLPVVRAAFLPGTTPLIDTKGTLKFAAKADQLTANIFFRLPPNQPIANSSLVLSFNGLTRTFMFDSRGRASSGNATARLTAKRSKDGASTAKLAVKFKGALKSDMSAGAALDAQGLPLQALIHISLPSAIFSEVIPLTFKKTRAGFNTKF